MVAPVASLPLPHRDDVLIAACGAAGGVLLWFLGAYNTAPFFNLHGVLLLIPLFVMSLATLCRRIAQPWAVIERDDKGTLPLRTLLTPRAEPGVNGATETGENGDETASITVADLRVDGGGLRIVDVRDPSAPQEVGHFIPEPPAGRAGPQTNDVDLDNRGLIYVVDRGPSFDILEFDRSKA